MDKADSTRDQVSHGSRDGNPKKEPQRTARKEMTNALMNEIEEKLHKWRKIVHVYGQENNVKTSLLYNLIYRFGSIPIKTSAQ